ncbi:hypothetical protein AX17_001849 [Amanita inopinata Kibby_2008]|nr:hypothetical protein AX17_001849 [Amanita inopinata Kibby_2008]
MATSTHHIRTIHSSFAAPPSPPWGSNNVLFNLGGLVNQYPPGLGFGPQEIPSKRSVNRRRPPYNAPSMPLMPSRHSNIQMPRVVYTSYRQSPSNKFDPFADENMEETVHAGAASPASALRSSPVPRNKVFWPAPPLSETPPLRSAVWPSNHDPATTYISMANHGGNDRVVSSASATNMRDARAKLVAGILLNRVYAVGKPMRHRCFSGESRGYVKSGLSMVITADA